MAARQDIKTWIEGYDRNFDQLCQALMWQLANKFGSVASTQPSAIAAYRVEANAGRIQPGVGPAGSFVYWEIGKFGHVGFVLENGDIFMGTRHLEEEWGPATRNAGIASNDFYVGRTGARLLGWSWQNGGNTVPFEATVPPTPTPPAPAGTWDYNLGAADWKRIQAALKARGRYSGPVDGFPGSNTHRGVQITCQNVGYSGPVDGIPGERTCHFVQVYAQKFGDYKGPVDSLLGPNSWAGFALGLERP